MINLFPLSIANGPQEVPRGEGCAIRVGSETRQWVAGEVLAFDDSFEHEVPRSASLPPRNSIGVMHVASS